MQELITWLIPFAAILIGLAVAHVRSEVITDTTSAPRYWSRLARSVC